MRVRLRRAWIVAGHALGFAGDVVAVDAAVGRQLLADGRAVPADADMLETAAVGPSETAARTARPEPRLRSG